MYECCTTIDVNCNLAYSFVCAFIAFYADLCAGHGLLVYDVS